MQHSVVRRSASAFVLLGALIGQAMAFGFDEVALEARARAERPYQPVPALTQHASDYDRWRELRFRPERALWRGEGRGFEAQFFAARGLFTRPVELFEVVDGEARPLAFTRGDFVRGAEPVRDDPEPAALAGVRLLHPLNRSDHFDEVIAFLGASYFRALGAGHQYGSSARGLALDTTGGGREEFPAFVRFWLQRPPPGATAVTVYALLDGPRAAGAYRFDIRPGAATEVDVRARITLRAPVHTFGVAPLTSMFFSGENQPAAGDFRPEVHDADGLQLATAGGEWLWRPLTRPRRPFATSFAVDGLRGFGLMQRDRDFASYQDLEAHYHRRPSVWVQPLGAWGAGRVQLLQLPAADETEDNIAAFWVPATPPKPGQPLDLAWRLVWTGALAPGSAGTDGATGPTGSPGSSRSLGAPGAAAGPGAIVVQTRLGFGWRAEPPPPGQLQFQIDFAGPALAALPAGAAVEPVLDVDANARVLQRRAEPNPSTGGWRLTAVIERIDPARAVELRAFLRHGRDALSETWSYAIAPE